MECLTCAGTEFIKESGYFYCVECQTQSQEVREHVFQDEVTNVKNTKKIKSVKSAKLENKITSWECYNIVMCGLTRELLNLGAKQNLKKILKCLWLKYLEKLEILDLDADARPKFAVVNMKRDVKILFNEGKKKRKRKRIEIDDSVYLDTTFSSIKRERSKKKRELAQAQYDEYSMKSTQESNLSLMSETLTSLKSSENSEPELEIRFNRSAEKELYKRMPKYHVKLHSADISATLNCHKFTYEKSTERYKRGVQFLSPIKMYSILYLGLLINRDNIHLGDLLRFIREGHLSFNSYRKFFPEEFDDKYLNIQNNSKNNVLSHKHLREVTAKLASFLDVRSYIEVPDLPELCRRYCNELNLPDEIYLTVKTLLAASTPSMKLDEKASIIPNYEGRSIALILFSLKLLFGLDGITEFHISKYAKILNDSNLKRKMFDINSWMEYLGYRKLIINENHLPTAYLKNSSVNSDLLLQYITSHSISLEANVKLTKEMNEYKQVMTKLKNSQHDYITFIEYPPSLTPFLKYTQTISNLYKDKYLKSILDTKFENESTEFLLNPSKYLKFINVNVTKRNKGANDNWIVGQVETCRSTRGTSWKKHNLVPIQIVQEGYVDSSSSEDESVNKKLKMQLNNQSLYPDQFQILHEKMFNRNEKYLERLDGDIDLTNIKINSDETYFEHFQPYERYWLNLIMNLDTVTMPNFQTFFRKYPSTFKFVFNECCRIVEQSYQEFFDEYQLTEMYLIYASNKKIKSKRSFERKLNYYINLAESKW